MATNTSATNNKDTQLFSTNPTTNYGSGTDLNTRETAANGVLRSILHFTLPSGSGTISKISLFIKQNTALASPQNVYAHQLTQTAWVEAEATWNIYSTGNNWTSAGGDYSGTEIDNAAAPGVGNFAELVLVGAGATNPLTLTWGDNVHLLLKTVENGNSTDKGAIYYSKETASSGDRPYVEITYSVATSAGKRASNIMLMKLG